MFRRTEVRHAKEKPLPYRAVACRGRRAVPASHEIYVAVLSSRPGQDDPPRRRRLGQRRDCFVPAYATRNREPVAQALLRRPLGGLGRSGSPGPTTGFFPQTWWCRSRRWRVNCQPRSACRSRASVWPTWRSRRGSWGWSRPSVTAPSGAGSTRMPFGLGSTAAGSFPATPSLPSRQDAFSIFINGCGRARCWGMTSSCCPPMRRRVSRRELANTRHCRPSPARPCASSTNTSAAALGPTWPLLMSIAPKCLAAASARVALPRSNDSSTKSCSNRPTTKRAGSSGSWTMAPRIAVRAASPDSRRNFHDWFPCMVPFMPVGSIRSRSTSPSCNARSLPPTTSRRWPPSRNDCWLSKPTMKRSLNPLSGNSLDAILPRSSIRSTPQPSHYSARLHDQQYVCGFMNQSTNPEARRDPRGVVVDVVARELGVRLGIPVRVVAYDRPAVAADAAKSGEWDIAFPAIEPARATMILFSRPYATIEASYLVRENAPWRSVEEFDQTDMRIAVARGSAYDLFLTRSLMAAQLVRGPVNRRGGEGSACWKRRRCGWHSPL